MVSTSLKLERDFESDVTVQHEIFLDCIFPGSFQIVFPESKTSPGDVPSHRKDLQFLLNLVVSNISVLPVKIALKIFYPSCFPCFACSHCKLQSSRDTLAGILKVYSKRAPPQTDKNIKGTNCSRTLEYPFALTSSPFSSRSFRCGEAQRVLRRRVLLRPGNTFRHSAEHTSRNAFPFLQDYRLADC